MSARPRDPRIGALIAEKYRVVDKIARGGMARIYKAEQLPLGRIVALKELITSRDKVDGDPEFQRRFFLEASTLSKLSPPNTVRVFDYGQFDDAFYMVMEYVEGRTLSAVLRDEGALDPVRALQITIEITRSLQEAHQLGIVHRDLKPSNVMLVQTVEGEAVKVLDFGIAKVMQENAQSITMDDRIVGSPRYMAPEQIRHGEVDARTDIYALGVLLFELLTGKPPYSGDKTLETLMAHLNDPIPSVRERSPFEIPEDLDDLVRACLAKKQPDRPQSAGELKELLRQALLEIAETTTAGVGLSTESLVRRALDRRDRSSGSHPRLDIEPALSQPTLDRPAEERRGGAYGWIIVLVVMLGGFTGIALLLVALLSGLGSDPVAAPTPPLTDALTAPEPAPKVAATLRLTSTPEGAEVWEGTRLHGITPLELPLSPDAGQRQFKLELKGHEPFAVVQGPSEQPVSIHAELIPVPTPPEPKPVPKASPRPSPKPKPKPKEDLDILFER